MSGSVLKGIGNDFRDVLSGQEISIFFAFLHVPLRVLLLYCRVCIVSGVISHLLCFLALCHAVRARFEISKLGRDRTNTRVIKCIRGQEG